MAIIAYIGVLCFVTLLASKDSKFARYHANQGLVLFITEILYYIAISILSYLFDLLPINLSFIIGILRLMSLGFFVLTVIGIMNAQYGKIKELPIIGQFKILK